MNKIIKKVNEVIVAFVDGMEYEFADQQQIVLAIGHNPTGKVQNLYEGIEVDCITIIAGKAHFINPKKLAIKGEYNSLCYKSSCINGNARYYNHSTKQHYCTECADTLNNDVFNKRDAQRLYGHELCTLVDEKCMPDQYDKFNSESEICQLKQLLHTAKKGLDMLIDDLAQVELGAIKVVDQRKIIESILIRNKIADKL